MLASVFTIVAFVVVFGLLVLVHELGHFIAAKLSGVKVEEFAIGFGPVLLNKEYKGTKYQIRVLPIGGFVQMKGERGKPSNDKDAYVNQPLRSKLFILFAGVFMNAVLAVLLASLYLGTTGYRTIIQDLADFDFVGAETLEIPLSLQIGDISEGSPIESDVLPGDLLVMVGDEEIESLSQVLEWLDENQGTSVQMTFVNLDDYLAYQVVVELMERVEEDDPVLGASFLVSGSDEESAMIPAFYVSNYPENVLSGFSYAYNVFFYQIAVLGSSVTQAVADSNPAAVTDQLGGPVAIYDLVGQIISTEQVKELINLTMVLSLALAFFNALPIPLLDGGQAVIETVETIRGKKLSERTINILSYVGLGVLMLLFVFVFLKDLRQVGIIDSFINLIQQAIGR